MKKLFFIAILILIGNSINAQTNKGMCSVEINDVSKAISFNYLLGYTVTFKNNTKKTVDGIYWKVYYYNNYVWSNTSNYFCISHPDAFHNYSSNLYECKETVGFNQLNLTGNKTELCCFN